jgi:uncharacterized protein YwqG
VLLLVVAVVLLSAAPAQSGRLAVGQPTQAPPADVREAAQMAGYGEYADRIVRAVRPAVFVRPGAPGRMPAAVGTSRLFGDPDLPAGARWPRCKDKPQTFLGQIRMRDLPAGARELRRHGGVLLFFTQVELGDDQYGLWAGDCSTVIHARSGEQLVRTAAPRRDTLRLRTAPARLVQQPDIPSLGVEINQLMPPLEEIRLESWEGWFDFQHQVNGRPPLEHKLLGYSYSPNGGNACSARAERPKRTWRHLMTFGYDEDRGFMVADGGTLQLLISPADLRAGRFDRVCGVFDSA